MSKHTPKPWQAVFAYACPQIISRNGSVATVSRARKGFGKSKPMTKEESHANAHLMVAAPEMYEALVNAEAALPDDSFALKLVKAAIAKAEGKA